MGETVVIASDDARWQGFVERRADATAFHDVGWTRTLADAYGFHTFVIARVEGAEVVAGTPMVALGKRRSRRWVALPFTDECRPLGEPADRRTLVHDLDEMRDAHGLDAVELRGSTDTPPGTPFQVGVTHELSLDPDPERVRARLHPSQARRNVDRAAREGVAVTCRTDRDALLETFYRLHLVTRRRQGVPIQPRRFFARLWEHVVARGRGFVLVATVDGRAAAAAVFLESTGTLTYKFGASDPQLLGARPNHAIFWTAIERACLAGCTTFDLGRTDTGNTGLRAFKASWGATERPLVYTGLGRVRAVARDRGKVLRPVISHAPLIVCRVLGEGLYKRAA
ncbi:MAG TPA: GNAT family N-acetyltransferase [Gaiella sp.]|nr:GNAT family N-acetyltransferase [Gaiella sp.]